MEIILWSGLPISSKEYLSSIGANISAVVVLSTPHCQTLTIELPVLEEYGEQQVFYF